MLGALLKNFLEISHCRQGGMFFVSKTKCASVFQCVTIWLEIDDNVCMIYAKLLTQPMLEKAKKGSIEFDILPSYFSNFSPNYLLFRGKWDPPTSRCILGVLWATLWTVYPQTRPCGSYRKQFTAERKSIFWTYSQKSKYRNSANFVVILKKKSAFCLKYYENATSVNSKE